MKAMEIVGVEHRSKKYTSINVRMTKNELKLFNSGRYEIRILPTNTIDGKQFDIVEAIKNYYHLTDSDLRVKKGRTKIVVARMWIFYFLREYTTLSLAKIGRTIGKDHATVLHYLKKQKNEMFYQDTRLEKARLESYLKALNIIE